MLSANAHIKTGHAFGSGWAGWPLGSTPVFYWQVRVRVRVRARVRARARAGARAS